MPPFSYEVKREIKDRAGGYVCEISGIRNRPMENMHLFHGRGDIFNKAWNGLIVADIIHLAYHMRHWNNPELIGLKREENFGAIRLCTARVNEFNWNMKMVDQFEEQIRFADEQLDRYLSEHKIPTKEELKYALMESR